jgi:hypothetical protein
MSLSRNSVPSAPASKAFWPGSGPTVRDSNVGYLDSALLGDQFRFRYDTSYDLNRPSRAEFFWPRGGPFGPGPARPETSVDYQDLSAYLEKQVADRLSAFVEAPVRFLNPEVNASSGVLMRALTCTCSSRRTRKASEPFFSNIGRPLD